MSYIIEPIPLITFIEDSQMKLPRFQRKSSWDKKQNFELCISVFQNYPVGVVIVNKEQSVSWLLDGRQRRNALKQMRDNPVDLYNWAKAYIGFKKNADPYELSNQYWGKVEKYLQAENHDQSNDPNSSVETNNDYDGEEDEVENSFNSEKQKEGLKLLLDIILMVHQINSNVSRWEKAFDFTKYCPTLKYAPKRDGYKINPVILRRFLLELIKNTDNLSEDSFVDYYEDNCGISDSTRDKFLNDVNKNWDYIKHSLEIIHKSEELFKEARIGVIRLTNVSPLDAQIIFSRVNSGGTLLKAEELLSAKPFWNIEVSSSDSHIKKLVNELYTQLGVEIPQEIVRWDLAATLISRIDKNCLVFEKNITDKMSMAQVTLGFKLLSSWFRGGMSAILVNELEKDNSIDWENDITDLVEDINKVCEILMNDSFFKFFQSWNKPISKLLGNAISLEFITIVLKDWIDRDRPTVSGAQYKSVQRDARILFDRLVYEYSTKVWRGSGDSKMASDIKDWRNRITAIPKTDWSSFINGALFGTYNGQKTTQKTLTPILYYYYCLSECGPINTTGVTYDVDHIIPQEKFSGNQMVNQDMKDSLTNLALLPKKDNISKGSKALNEITDSWLKSAITTYTGINESDYDKYSDITNILDMKKARGKILINCFDKTRDTVLSN